MSFGGGRGGKVQREKALRTRLLPACAPCAVQEAARVSLFCSQILSISFSSHLQV